ncbi:hypothetical protein C4K88_03745 [Arthrobacter pityocampae]|uniref:Uncharacterized protein n=1 Tax=Arthrobacter pityocampae TaxID=547334 RepID=A0A2S5J2C4_9MICC|nr:hypothetical protein C4K88_03745 [Arthrobacter pityocampae]
MLPEGPGMRRLAPLLLVIVGVALMVAQIRADSEPGAIPLALVVLGLSAYLVLHVRRRRAEDRPPRD